MDWFVMRHPETDGVGVVPETALDIWRPRGWVRCSDGIPEGEKDHVVFADHAVDLDAAPDEPPAKATAKTSPKEK
jgi:hypothetical protein